MQILYIMQNLGLVDSVGLFFLIHSKITAAFILKNLCWINLCGTILSLELSPMLSQLSYASRSATSAEIWQNLWLGEISPVVLCWCFTLLHSVSLNRQLLISWQLNPMDNLLMLCWPGKGFGDRQRWSSKAAITVGRALCSYRRKEKISFMVNELFAEK